MSYSDALPAIPNELHPTCGVSTAWHTPSQRRGGFSYARVATGATGGRQALPSRLYVRISWRIAASQLSSYLARDEVAKATCSPHVVRIARVQLRIYPPALCFHSSQSYVLLPWSSRRPRLLSLLSCRGCGRSPVHKHLHPTLSYSFTPPGQAPSMSRGEPHLVVGEVLQLPLA